MLVLQGLIASMRDGAPASVSGAVHIGDDGLIAAVTPLDPEPAGFAGAPRVATGGVIYPGSSTCTTTCCTTPCRCGPSRPAPRPGPRTRSGRARR
jgi:hypothetical protein